MPLATISNARDVVEVLIGAVSVLGGVMAVTSGRAASKATTAGDEPEVLAFRVNDGLADGFESGLPVAVIVSLVLAFT